MKRKRLKAKTGSVYFDDLPKLEFIPSGCSVLDCVLGGGWASRRIVNVVGDRSTGKTLCAIEASANFFRKYKDQGARVRYNEAEEAFDQAYAEQLGMQVERVEFPDHCLTVEDVFNDIQTCAKEKGDEPLLYIIDSLDALTDAAETARDISDDGWALQKQKKLSELFRRLVKPMARGNITLFIVSQVRDNIGVTFGKKQRRSGGKALDFYCSQVLWLAKLKMLTKTRKGVKRPVGVQIKAKCEKNKVSSPFRECEVPILFSYGMDDVTASFEFLSSVKRLDALGLNSAAAMTKRMKEIDAMEGREYRTALRDLRRGVRNVWDEIEEGFKPARRKYR